MKRDVLLNQGIALYFYFFIGYRLAVGSLVLTPLTLTALFTPKSRKLLPQGSGFKQCGDGFNSSFCAGEAGVKGRLEEIGKGRIKLWWDIGREGKASFLVRDVNGIAKDKKGMETKHKLAKSKETRVRIESDAIFVKMFLDDELVWEGKEINGANKGGRIGLGTHATAVEFSDFVITDLVGQGVEPGGKVTTTWGSLKTR